MKKAACLVFFWSVLSLSVSAQFVSPVPIAESEMRDMSSAKRRAIELDRVKREANKPVNENLGPAGVNHFLDIKADFENIQTSEISLVKIYTTQKTINFKQIALFALSINQSAARLKEHLFTPPKTAQTEKPTTEIAPQKVRISVSEIPQLIVALDQAIGEFVGSPLFVSSKKARPKDREKAQDALENVIAISDALKIEADKSVRPKN